MDKQIEQQKIICDSIDKVMADLDEEEEDQ